jgi:hypothetical protein
MRTVPTRGTVPQRSRPIPAARFCYGLAVAGWRGTGWHSMGNRNTLRSKHADPAYKRARAYLIPAAHADPDTRCPAPGCGLTLAEKQRTKPGDGWDCGHPEPDALTGLARTTYTAWHSSCNRSHGAAKGNRSRFGNALGL